jgi:hypothetical protein
VNLLQLLEITIEVPPFTSERVNSDRALYFDVSSQYLTQNTAGFIFLFANMVLISFVMLITSQLRTNHFIRKQIEHKKD